MTHYTRRAVLGAIPFSFGVPRSINPSNLAPRQQQTQPQNTQVQRFRPTTHGFGFQNWSTVVPTFPEHRHETISEDTVRERIETMWNTSLKQVFDIDVTELPSLLHQIITKQIYVSVNQRSATNGHCYGMTYAAQKYYEQPDNIPFDRRTASELTHPAEPVSDPTEEPVGADIDFYQNQQFLNLYAWIGRRLLVRPSWIDYAQQLENLKAVVDLYGTAGITLMNTTSKATHQVLVYDVSRNATKGSLWVYEPNAPASMYAGREDNRRWRIDVDTTHEQPFQPYGSKQYDAFVFNRYDRIMTASEAAEPIDNLTDEITRNRLFDDLFTAILVLVDSPNVHLSVVDPRGRPLGREVSTFIDRRHTEYHDMRYQYGAHAGQYQITVLADEETSYTLDAFAANPDGQRLDATITGTLNPSESHAYLAQIPADDSTGSIERVDGSELPFGILGVGIGVAGISAGAYLAIRNRGSCEMTDSRNE